MGKAKLSKELIKIIRWWMVVVFFIAIISSWLFLISNLREIKQFAITNEVLFSSILWILWYLLVRIIAIHRDVEHEESIKNFSILEVFFFPVAIIFFFGVLLYMCDVQFVISPLCIALVLSCIWLVWLRIFIIKDMHKIKTLNKEKSDK